MMTKTMFGFSIAAIFAIAMVAGLSGQIPFVAADNGEIELKTVLLDIDGNEVGEAKFELKDDGSELKVELEDSTPDVIFGISIEGMSVGLIATDSDGEGKAKWEPSPVMISDGDTIVLTRADVIVSSLTGIFAAEVDDDKDDDEDD
jgi:hypothetical protein